METLEHLPGGLATAVALLAILVFAIYFFVKKTVKLAVVGLALFFALGGWAWFEAASERAEKALERAKEAGERVEKSVREVEKQVKKRN